MQTERHTGSPDDGCGIGAALPPAADRRPRPHVETVRRRLRQSAERLVHLLELRAPEPFVANEIMLLMQRGLSSSPSLGEFIGRWMMNQARVQGGICTRCGERDILFPDRGLCGECAAEEDAEREQAEQEVVQEYGPLAQSLLDGVEQALAERLAEEERWLAGDGEVES